MMRFKIGLALGSGAARGLAHIGVLRALEENAIRPDIISGTSIGAVVGGLYAAGLPIWKISEFASEFGDKRLSCWMDASFFKDGGFLKGDKIENSLKDLMGSLTFRDLQIPFYAVATNLATGKEVVISKGDVAKAIRASFAIPGVFAPVQYDGDWLVDGALVEPIPTKILCHERCNVIIAVNVTGVSGERFLPAIKNKPSVFSILMQTLVITQQKVSEPGVKLAHVTILPDVWNIEWTEFSRSEELIEAGYRATMNLIPAIKRKISRRRKIAFLTNIFQ